MNLKGKKTKNQVVTANIFEQQELLKKAEVIREKLTASTWHELETNGKFDKNAKLSFISDDMLILGCDVGSETHYLRAIDPRGRELSKSAYSFRNNCEGFQSAKEWAVELAAKNEKKQIVLGLEPTGHYWFCLATWMIANLVKDGNFGMPYLPEKVYAELRRLSMFREQLNEDRIRAINRMHREMKIYFPEYKEALGRVEGAFSLELLKQTPFPEEIQTLGEEGIRQIWHDAKLRGRGYSRVREIVGYAKTSVGMKDGAEASAMAVKWFVKEIRELDEKLAEIEKLMREKYQEIPYAKNILEISGIGENTLSGILAEMGDISRFDDVKEIQKLSGLGLVACSSGKHKGETKISHRGRKRLRYWLFQAAKSAVAHAEEFKELHVYYTTRADNPLKKMQSLIVIACKLLRIIYGILKNGTVYDPKKMLRDIRRPEKKEVIAA